MHINKQGIRTVKGFVNNIFLHDSKDFVYPLIGFNTLWGYEEFGYFCIAPCERVSGYYNCIRYISLESRKADHVDTKESVSTTTNSKIPVISR